MKWKIEVHITHIINNSQRLHIIGANDYRPFTGAEDRPITGYYRVLTMNNITKIMY